MEKKIYDLNEYSLEVKDGKAVLKKKRKEFKPGDVLVGPVGQVVIYAGTCERAIVTYCGYNTDVFSCTMGTGWGYTGEFNHASEEQKAMLFAEIKKRGYVWDAEELELRKNPHGRTDFKHGDFVCFGSGRIGIYKDKAKNGELFWTRCLLDKDKFTSYCSEHPYTNVRLASEEEKKRLLAAIDKGGFIWDSENSEMKKKFDFEDGAFVADADGDLFIHWKNGDTCYSHGSYVYWNRESDDIVLRSAWNMTTGTRYATNEEIEALNARLAKKGLEWDSKNKRLRKKRWRAKNDEKYWIINEWCCVVPCFEEEHSLDTRRYKVGNYFRTKEEAEKVAEEVRKIFEKYGEE